MAAFEADRQADIDRYKIFEQQCHKDDKEFITYAVNIIEEKNSPSNSVVPLIKTLKVSSVI